MKQIYLSILLVGLLTITSTAFSQVSPVEIGRASNAYTILRTQQNQVYADDSSRLVAFVHRQDVTIWGGGNVENGKLRVGISVDAGLSFKNFINGTLNTTYSFPARYPQITGYNRLNSKNPLDLKLAWTAPTLGGGSWDGFASGLSIVDTTLISSTETYNERGENSYLQGGLCEGLPGEYWMADLSFNGTIGDSIRIYQGTYNTGTQDIVWNKHLSTLPNFHLGSNGFSTKIDPNIAFSPDGNTGWVALLGDLVGGSDLTLQPIFMKSQDGGATWSNPTEVNLQTISYIGDYPTLKEELQSVWLDSLGNPASSGVATCSFNYDVTVDADGNPHVFVVVCSKGSDDYSLFPGLVKVAVDITSDDGGFSWKAIKIAPVYTFRGTFGTPDPNNGSLLVQDNHTQISRTEDGSHIFYSWVDSDTSVLGFGANQNLAPNLRIAGLRIGDGYQACAKWITLNDVIWDGKALFPTMAPTVLTQVGTADFSLPIVMLDLLESDQNRPCKFWYFGTDASFSKNDFIAESSNLNTDSCYVINPSVGIEEYQFSSPVIRIYPNPSTGIVSIEVEDNTMTDMQLTILDVSGKVVQSQEITVSSGASQIDISSLQRGFYLFVISEENGKVYTKQMVKM